MKVQYREFCLNSQAEEAAFCVEDTEKLNSFSIQELVQLKSDLYGVYNLDNEEFAALLNDKNRAKIKDLSQMNADELRIAKALFKLDIHARKRMLKIARNFRNKTPSASKQDIFALSFVFRNNGKNFTPYPEIKQMNDDAAWYYHQRLFARKKSVLMKFFDKNVHKIKNSAMSFVENYIVGFETCSDDKCSPSSKAKTPAKTSFSLTRVERTH